MLRVDRYDDPDRGCLLIEIALCNDRETAAEDPGQRLAVPDQADRRRRRGRGVPAQSATRCSTTRREHDDEVRRLNLQYRDRLEFAVGPDLLGRLEGGRRGAAGDQGVDHLAADLRDAAGHRRGDRRAARHARAGDGTRRRSCATGLRRSSSGTRSGSTRRRPGRSSCPRTCARRAWTRSAEARKVHRQLADGLEHLLDRSGGAALLPVHERGDGRPADAVARSPGAARRTPMSPSTRPAPPCSPQGAQPALVVHVPARVHPHAAAAAHRSGGGASGRATWPPRSCCSSPPAAARPRRTWASPPTRSRSGGGRRSSTPPTGRSTGGPG